jgi:hypothetical protein
MEMSGQLHAPGKEPPVPIEIGGWVDPIIGLDVVEKRKSLSFAGN